MLRGGSRGRPDDLPGVQVEVQTGKQVMLMDQLGSVGSQLAWVWG